MKSIGHGILLSVGLVLLGGCADLQKGIDDGVAAARVQAASASAVTAPGAHIGTVVELGNWRYRILQSDVLKSVQFGDGYLAQTVTAKGNYIVVLVELTNIGRQNFTINSFDFELRDDKGIVYNMADFESFEVAGARGQARLGEQMPPTVTLRTTLLFDVAPGTNGMYIRLKNGGTGRIDLF